MNPKQWEEERKNYPLLNTEIYLDHATTGLLAEYSYEAMKAYLENRLWKGMNIEEYFQNWTFLDELREDFGTMFHCRAKEIVYGASSSHLFNLFANGIRLSEGDNIVTTDITYPADSYIWLNQEKRGIELRFAKTCEGYISAEELLAYSDEHTKVVCICMVESKSGFRHDLEAIGAYCRQKGILLAVDATQAANVLEIDVQKMQIDFMATSGYKWFQSVVGVGVAYMREQLLAELEQSQVGWVGTKDRRHNDPGRLDLSEEAKRFETGGLNFVGYHGMAQVVGRYRLLGGTEIETYIMSVVDYVYEKAKELKRIRIYGDFPRKNRSQIVTFLAPEELGVTTEKLMTLGLRCRCFEGKLIRVGFHYCNTAADADYLLECLKRLEEG